MTTQGYIGISNNPVKRWQEHKRKARNNGKPTIYRAMRKYNDVQFDVILHGDRRYCEDIEIALRPTPKIGWNIAIGGEDSTKEATLQSQQSYLSKRIANAAYYWYKAEIKLLTLIHNKQTLKAKRQAKAEARAIYEPIKNHGERKQSKCNTSGYTGVGWYPKYQLWRTQICIDRTLITLGYYPTAQEAHTKYLLAKSNVYLYRARGMDAKPFITLINNII